MIKFVCVVTFQVTSSRFTSLSGAFACQNNEASAPGGFMPPGIFFGWAHKSV